MTFYFILTVWYFYTRLFENTIDILYLVESTWHPLCFFIGLCLFLGSQWDMLKMFSNLSQSVFLFWSCVTLFTRSIEICLFILFIYFQDFLTNKRSYRNSQTFYSWRSRQITRDLEFCHPRWAQEKSFLEAELKSLSSERGPSLFSPSFFLECFTYISILVVIATRLAFFFLR